jgi:hypothetical protein
MDRLVLVLALALGTFNGCASLSAVRMDFVEDKCQVRESRQGDLGRIANNLARMNPGEACEYLKGVANDDRFSSGKALAVYDEKACVEKARDKYCRAASWAMGQSAKTNTPTRLSHDELAAMTDLGAIRCIASSMALPRAITDEAARKLCELAKTAPDVSGLANKYCTADFGLFDTINSYNTSYIANNSGKCLLEREEELKKLAEERRREAERVAAAQMAQKAMEEAERRRHTPDYWVYEILPVFERMVGNYSAGMDLMKRGYGTLARDNQLANAAQDEEAVCAKIREMEQALEADGQTQFLERATKFYAYRRGDSEAYALREMLKGYMNRPPEKCVNLGKIKW